MKMGVINNSTDIPRNLTKWLYQTEYSRSFDKLNVNQKVNEDPDKKERVISRYVESTNGKGISRKNLITVNTDTKLDSNPYANKLLQSSSPLEKKTKHRKVHSTCGRKIRFSNDGICKSNTSDDQKRNNKIENVISSQRLPNKEISQPKANCNVASDINETFGKTHIIEKSDINRPQSLSVIAGKESNLYERAPFIQSKKRLHVPNSDHFICNGVADIVLRNKSNEEKSPNYCEPPLQTKKIVPYYKNHNILRTDTVEFRKDKDEVSPILKALYNGVGEKDELDKSYLENVLSRYQKHRSSVPEERYQSSYNLHYSLQSFQNSPVISAESAVKQANCFEEGDTANDEKPKTPAYIYKKTYSPRDYCTEYATQFKENRNENVNTLMKPRKDAEFGQYFQKVLRNRHHAYHPSKNSGDTSPFKKIETKQEVNGSKQELEIQDLYDSATEDDVKKKKETNNFKVTDNNKLSIGNKNSETSSFHETEDGKTALSKKKSRLKKYTSSISGDSIGGSSYCSCSTYPNSYDPSLYSDRSDNYD